MPQRFHKGYSCIDLPLPGTLANRGGANSDGAVLGEATITSATYVATYDNSATTFTDQTTDAGDAGAGDVELEDPWDTNDYLLLMHSKRFFGFQTIIGTAGVGAATAAELTLQYYNGSSWATLESGFELDDDTGTAGAYFEAGTSTYITTFVPPPLWAPVTLNSQTGYAIRWLSSADDVYDTTNPILSRLRVLPLNAGDGLTSPHGGVVDSIESFASVASATNNDTELLIMNVTQGTGCHYTWTGGDYIDSDTSVTELGGGPFRIRQGDKLAVYCLAEDGTTEFAQGGLRLNLR